MHTYSFWLHREQWWFHVLGQCTGMSLVKASISPPPRKSQAFSLLPEENLELSFPKFSSSNTKKQSCNIWKLEEKKGWLFWDICKQLSRWRNERSGSRWFVEEHPRLMHTGAAHRDSLRLFGESLGDQRSFCVSSREPFPSHLVLYWW